MKIDVKIQLTDEGTLVYTEDYTEPINLDKEISKMEHDPRALSLRIIQLMSKGMSRNGVLLFIKGKLDTARELKKYCNEALLPYNDIMPIINPSIC